MIAGGGVLLCWLAEATVLPAMIRLTDADGVQTEAAGAAESAVLAAPAVRLSAADAGGGTASPRLVLAVGMHYLRYDYNLLNLQPVGLESVELEHKLFNQTNRSAWFALSMANTPEEVAARKEAFLRLPSVERVVEVATKIARRRGAEAADHRADPPAAGESAAAGAADSRHSAGRTRSDACRRAGDALVAARRRAGGRRTAATARDAAADSARRIQPPRLGSISRAMAADLLDAAADAPGRLDARAAAVGRSARKRARAIRRQDAAAT